MADRRTALPPHALLELGDISGVLHEIHGQRPVDNSVRQLSEAQTKQEDDANKVTVPDPIPNDTAPKDDAAKSEKDKKEDKKEKTQVPPKQDTVADGKDKNTPSQQPATAKPRKAARSSDCWNDILTRLKAYKHTVNQKEDCAIWIEHTVIETLRSCFGARVAGRLVNAILLWYIDNNKDRLRELQSRRNLLI